MNQESDRMNPTREIEPETNDNNAHLSLTEVKHILEAFLFSCHEPMPAEKLAKLAGDISSKVATGLLNELKDEYNSRPSGIQIVEIAGGYQMATRPHLADWIVRLQKQRRRTVLSPATLETLAIIAYKQPVTRAEIESIRGVESSTPLRTLVELNIVAVGGKKDIVGRPPLYITTDSFLKIFGLNSLSDLPSIPELKEMFAGQYSWFSQYQPDHSAPQSSLQVEQALFGPQPADTEETAETNPPDEDPPGKEMVEDLFGQEDAPAQE